jgi:hypothetical protein
MTTESTFTHLIIKKTTRRKISLLATVLDERIYKMLDTWAELEWRRALKVGLVKDSMLEAGERVKA